MRISPSLLLPKNRQTVSLATAISAVSNIDLTDSSVTLPSLGGEADGSDLSCCHGRIA
ncbi:hypothetical protein [Parapedobacter sp. DT-150]|uniref:hypothetical protein n=1 Tax=Parapedobacter sp. DT-150 TaxID=3396162 RepID=UPI003F53F2D5